MIRQLTKAHLQSLPNATSASYDYTQRGDLTDHDWSFAASASANYDFTYNSVG